MRMWVTIIKDEFIIKLKLFAIPARDCRKFLALALVLFTLATMSAQTDVQAEISVSFSGEKLSEVLQFLSESEQLNFSYAANDPAFDTRISYTADEQSLEKILVDILSEAGLAYKQIGNQIVLFKADRVNAETPEDEIREEANTEVSEGDTMAEVVVPAVEMSYRLDTVFLMDTVYRVDTLRIIDTVFIEPEKPEKQEPSKIKELPVDYFQFGAERDKGWAMNIYAAPVVCDFSLVNGQKAFSLRSFSIGIDAVKLLERWNISLGARLSQFGQQFTQQYSVNMGGFYDTDTVDTYYTVINTDTSWYYVTDSSWVPVENREYSYDKVNKLGFLEFNLSASYDIYKSEKIRWYLKAGGQLSLLIYKNGIAIPGEDQAEVTDFDDIEFNYWNYSVTIGTGLKYKMADKVDFNTELYYAGYLNQLVPDYTMDTKFNAIGLKLGLIFYF
jgi:hypothetical protein